MWLKCDPVQTWHASISSQSHYGWCDCHNISAGMPEAPPKSVKIFFTWGGVSNLPNPSPWSWMSDNLHFPLRRVQMLSVSEKLEKSLGKIFDWTLRLRDSAAVQATQPWLTAVDHASQIYPHSVLPRLLWPLLIYEGPVTLVEGFEQEIIHSFTGGWAS